MQPRIAGVALRAASDHREIALVRRLVDYESPEPSRAKVETDRSLCKAIQENEHAQTDVSEHNHLNSRYHKPVVGAPLATPRVNLS